MFLQGFAWSLKTKWRVESFQTLWSLRQWLSSNCFPSNIGLSWSGEILSLSWTFAFTTLMVSVGSTSEEATFQLLPVEYKLLLIWRNYFFVLNFCFHYLNGVCRFYFQSGCLFRQCSYKDLHATTNSWNKNEESLSEHSHSENSHFPIASRQR